MLARTHYGLGSGISTVAKLPELFEQWENWSADVAESHATYPTLAYFRSANLFSSWITAQLAVLDAAALYLSLVSKPVGVVSARLCLRGGFTCLKTVAQAVGTDVAEDANPEDGISLSYREFVEAVERLRGVDFPITRSPEDAWVDFVGWRVNYEAAGYAIAYRVDAPPALWSGPRRHLVAAVPPQRPPTLGASKKQVSSRDLTSLESTFAFD